MRTARALLVTALIAASSACETTGRPSEPARSAPPTLASKRVSADFVPAFEALQSALEADDTRLARRLLARIWSRKPKGETRELAEGFERIVSGRECADGLELALECRAAPGAASASGTSVVTPVRVVLSATSRSARGFTLRPGPATLVITRTAVDARGNERSNVEITSCGDIPRLELTRGATLETELATLDLPFSDAALAVRMRVELEFRSGTFVRDGEDLPAQRLRVAAGEATARTAALEAAGPVEPGALAALASPGKFSATSALEIAVRVPPEARERALDALWPLVGTLPEVEVKRLVPALRWLALTSEPGGGAEAWRAYLRNRSVARAPGPKRERLDLPDFAPDEAQSRLVLEPGRDR